MSFDPTFDPFASNFFDTASLKAIFSVRSPKELAENPLFSKICHSLIHNELATEAKLKDQLGIPRKKNFNTGGDMGKRVEIIEAFAASITGSKPPSQPEQCAQPEEEPETPDWLRKAEERLSHSHVPQARRGNRTRAP